MSKYSLLLVKNGFVKDSYKALYENKTNSEKEAIAEEDHADEETFEEARNQFKKTGYPFPLKRWRIISESFNMSIEESYFWVLNYISQDLGYDGVIKTIDTFSASENSAFFGVSQQRVGLQQDKVSQFLATIGKMVKELFQLVRELRIIDERLDYYNGSIGIDKEGNKVKPKESDEITLKGIFIDQVQGGAKNPASVFGMSREVNYISLPDLFFSTHPQDRDHVDEYIDTHRGGFNTSVRNALKRHIVQYLTWKDKTLAELKTRRVFTLKYLRQHFDIIKMYMTWVKPYLRHIRRLTLDDERILTPDLISAFEGSMIEVEFLASKLPVDTKTQKRNKKLYACIIAHFLYRTRPSMSYQQEGYQRGPIHVGRMEFNLRGYIWTQKQIDNFKKMRDQEDLEMLNSISESVKSAMEALGGELENYLAEAGEELKKEEEKPKSKLSMFDLIKTEFMGSKSSAKSKPKGKGMTAKDEESEKSRAKKSLLPEMFFCFKNYKKAHRMVMW